MASKKSTTIPLTIRQIQTVLEMVDAAVLNEEEFARAYWDCYKKAPMVGYETLYRKTIAGVKRFRKLGKDLRRKLRENPHE